MQARRFSPLLLGVTGILILSTAVRAQIGGTGSIQGTLTDPSGAAIPGATVTATNTKTNIKTAQETTAAGLYTIAALPAGEYALTATATGFQSVTQEHVLVDALAVVTVNLSLQVGAVGETVTVSSAPPPLDTADSTLGSNMRNELYTALPLAMGNGTPRDPTAFVALVPGVQSVSTQPAGTSFASFNGGQPYLNEIYIEGIPQTNASVQGETRNLSLSISVEAIDQFQVETNDPPAMYEGQGVENYVLKAGTNDLHGSFYEYFRNTMLDARGFFPPTTPVEKQNEFGVNVGGPLKRDKLFFFGSYDGYYFVQGSTPTLQSIPTAEERQGNFAAFPQTIYDPYSTVCNSAGGGCARALFGGNVIPASYISPVSKSFQSYLPTPTTAGIQNNYLASLPIGTHVNNTTEKVDVNLTDKHRMYGFFSRGQYTTDPLASIVPANGDALPLPYTASRIVQEKATAAQFHDVYVFSPSLLNQFAYSFTRLYVPIINATASGAYPQKAGLAGLPPGQASLAFPTVTFNGPNAPISWVQNNTAFDEAVNTYVLQDNAQWVRGKHSMTIGGQVQWLQDNYTQADLGSYAAFTFNNSETAGFSSSGSILNTTGNAYASYLLGAVDSASITDNYAVTIGARYKDYAAYLQDDFKLNPKLTLNLGLRYNVFGTLHEVANRMSFLNPTLPNPAIGGYPGVLQFAGNGPDSCHCATPVPPHYTELGPRIGLAYQLNDKTVIRGGYAIMYAHGGGTSGRAGGRNGTGQLGYNANPGFSSPNPGAGAPAFFWSAAAAPLPAVYSGVYAGGAPPYQRPPFFNPSLNTGFCTGCPAAGGITYGDPQIGGKPPYFENWNFGIQRAVTSNMTLTLAYSASAGHFLATSVGRTIWSNQIDPRYLVL
ncbi:MAG: TonB-dependent receptor, partial [Acidobacteriaceae bacterium]|nr:TonB-dependent receptor [Acidobacteriaceae bacterium]